MSNTVETTPRDGAVPAYLEAGGRVYPLEAREKVRPSEGKGPARGANVGQQLADSIREQFHNRFIMDIGDAAYPDNDTLLEDYRHDIELVKVACDEVVDVLKRLYRLNTRFDFQAQDAWSTATDDEAMRDEQYRNWSKGLDLGIRIGDYALSTRLTQLLHDKGGEALEAKREECLSGFIHQLCGLLDEMVGKDLVGLVVFGPDQDCDFHFFRDVVIEYRSDKQTMTQVNERRTMIHTDGTRTTELTGIQFDVVKNRSVVRRTRQDIYLRDVDVVPFGNSRMPIAPEIHEFIASLPQWLQNACRIVEGDRYSQQFFDYEIEHLDWEQTAIRPFHSVLVQRTHRDPALTLGHYVLAGWDAVDVDEQQSRQEERWRRRQAATEATLSKSYSGSMLVAACVSLTVAMLAFGLLPEQSGRLLGALGVTGFIACGVGAFHFSAKSLGKRVHGVHHVLAGVLAIVCAAPMLCLAQAFRVGDWGLLWWLLLVPVGAALAVKLREVLPNEN